MNVSILENDLQKPFFPNMMYFHIFHIYTQLLIHVIYITNMELVCHPILREDFLDYKLEIVHHYSHPLVDLLNNYYNEYLVIINLVIIIILHPHHFHHNLYSVSFSQDSKYHLVNFNKPLYIYLFQVLKRPIFYIIIYLHWALIHYLFFLSI